LPLPLELLGEDNPILHYGEVVLFEDEMADKGFSRVNVRFRVMHDCFFVLLRSYTRVDHVLVRILDTRIFCRLPPAASGEQLEPMEIIRDFQHRESTYSQLKAKGFTFGSQWSLSPAQSDEIYGYLHLKGETRDRLIVSS
jgi:type 2A phosphatase activator TIP41